MLYCGDQPGRSEYDDDLGLLQGTLQSLAGWDRAAQNLRRRPSLEYIYVMGLHWRLVIGTVAIFLLSLRGQVSLRVMTALVVVVAILSLALFKSTKVLGRSYPVLNWAKRGVYHFQIVALVWILSFLWIAREPVRAYLDILVFGAIVYQAFLRVGCLMAGCCHGRLHTWGVCYGKKHKETGYLYFLEEVRLFPIQLIEALWLFLLRGGRPRHTVPRLPAGRERIVVRRGVWCGALLF